MSHTVRTNLPRKTCTITAAVTPLLTMIMTAILIMSGLILSGCAHEHSKSPERNLVYRSLEKHPAWLTQLPTHPDYFYAVGISTDAPSLRQGRVLAAKSAVVEVSNYLGLKAHGYFEVKQTELTTRILNEMSVTSSANLNRSSLSQMYYEEFRYEDDSEKANAFDVYILLKIPMADLKQERQRQEQRKQKILLEAKTISQEAQEHLNTGNFPLAWQKWMLAMRLTDEVEGDSVSSLQIYKALLTAVEGINLSVDEEPGQPSSETSGKATSQNSIIIAQALFSGKTGDVPLVDLPLRFRVSNQQAGKIRNTDRSGLAEYELSPSVSKGLQMKLIMSPYAVDLAGLSSGTTQKIQFLKSMLDDKMAQYGSMPFASKQVARSSVNARASKKRAGLAYTDNDSQIYVEAIPDNPFVLLDGRRRYNMTVKVDISPAQTESINRPPLNLAVVIDKSGSMNEDGKITYTKEATEFLINHLTTQDYLSIIAYSSQVLIVVPSELVSSKALLKHHLTEIDADGMTNLSGGLFAGHTQVKKHLNANGINRILLLSDGNANRGITDTEDLMPYIKQYSEEGISISALGVGIDYNEELMMALAENSNGNYYYIENPEDIPAIFSRELTRLINVAAKNIKVSIELEDGIKLTDSFGQAYTRPSNNRYEFRLGDLNYDERGILLLELNLPEGIQGTSDVATIEVTYDAMKGEGEIRQKNNLTVTYTHDADLFEESRNTEVDKYAVLTRSTEELERVLESLDRGLYEQAIKNIRKTYASIESFARGTEDAEFLQRLQLLKHFEHEVMELKESDDLHEHREELQKNLSYKLYLEKHSHRNLDHPLHYSD
ncbi:MAG: VWA domain-containing protein [Gammaproteobacteria bacterium]